MRSLLNMLPFRRSQTEAPTFQELVQRVEDKFNKTVDLVELAELESDELGREVHRSAELVCDRVCKRARLDLPETDRHRVVEAVLDEVFGLGPLEPLLRDPTVHRIKIDIPDLLVAESKDGEWVVDPSFRDEHHCRDVVGRMRHLDWCISEGGSVRQGSKVDILIDRASTSEKSLRVRIT